MLKLMQRIFAGGQDSGAGSKVDRLQLATAVLLLEVAHSDESLEEVEQHLVAQLVRGRFDLPQEELAELLALASETREQSVSLFRFATEINTQFSREDKLALLDELWKVVLADGVVDKYEEHLMRQLTSLLRFSHAEMIESKLKIKKAMA